jgi:hypothetical protein
VSFDFLAAVSAAVVVVRDAVCGLRALGYWHHRRHHRVLTRAFVLAATE